MRVAASKFGPNSAIEGGVGDSDVRSTLWSAMAFGVFPRDAKSNRKDSMAIKFWGGVVVAIMLMMGVPQVYAEPVINVFPSVAPNVFGSPYWSAYEANAIAALQGGATSAGMPNTPGFYSQVPNGTNLPVGAFTVTNFNSWLGNATPAATFGAAYGGEYGNRIHYGLHVISDTPFSLSQLAFNLTYDDATLSDFSVFSVVAGTYQYTSSVVGLNYGPDGIKGTADDFFITNGANTQLIHELFSRGSGLGYEVLTSFPGATNQEKIDLYNSLIWGTDPFTFTGTYTIGSSTGSAYVAFNTPEPASLALWSLMGAAGLAYRGWSRRRQERGATAA
jgi:hypothetical protein